MGVVVVLLLLVVGVVAVFVLYRTNAKVHRFIRQLRLPVCALTLLAFNIHEESTSWYCQIVTMTVLQIGRAAHAKRIRGR